MKIGLVYPQIELGGDPAAVRRIGLATEDMGFAHLLAYDHVLGAEHADREPALGGPYTEADPFHEPLTMFAYLAGLTERIEMATGILILPQRQTALVAKQAAEVDLYSGERLRLGVGTGWNHVEYTALGQDYAVRGPRQEEQIELLRRYWTEPLVSFEGRFEQVERANLLPRPTRSIPIWLGGFSEPAFRRAGKLGDGFIFAGRTDHAEAAWQRVQHHLDEAGRSANDFGRDLVTLAARSLDELLPMIEGWEKAGGTHLSVCSMGMGLQSTDAHLEFFAEVAKRVL